MQVLGDNDILDYILKRHMVQISQQMVITICNFCVCALTSEVAVVNAMLVY